MKTMKRQLDQAAETALAAPGQDALRPNSRAAAANWLRWSRVA